MYSSFVSLKLSLNNKDYLISISPEDNDIVIYEITIATDIEQYNQSIYLPNLYFITPESAPNFLNKILSLKAFI
jgi:hypothetical protein